MSSFSITSFPAISGGLPTRPDLAPSIVFAVAYFLLLFPAIWRAHIYRRPLSLLFVFLRFLFFVLIRITTFALRAQESVNSSIPFNPVPSIAIFITEQILLGIGFIVMLDLMVVLVQSHISRTDVSQQAETAFTSKKGTTTLQTFITIMHASLLAAIAMGIAAGAMYVSALNSTSASSTVRSLRIASTVIALAVVALTVLICLSLLIRWPRLGLTRTAYLLVSGSLLLIIPAYRLSTSVVTHVSLPGLISIATRVKFYILQALMEYVVAILLLAVDVRVWFFAGGKEAQMMLDGTHPHASTPRTKLLDQEAAEVEPKVNVVSHERFKIR